MSRGTPALDKRLKLDASVTYIGRAGAPGVTLAVISRLLDSDRVFEASKVCSLSRVATQHDSPFHDPNAPQSTVFGPVFQTEPGEKMQIWLKAQLVVSCNATAAAPRWSELFDEARIMFELKVVEQVSSGEWLVQTTDKVAEEGMHSALFFSNRRIIASVLSPDAGLET